MYVYAISSRAKQNFNSCWVVVLQGSAPALQAMNLGGCSVDEAEVPRARKLAMVCEFREPGGGA
jgi:hypothetical protein